MNTLVKLLSLAIIFTSIVPVHAQRSKDRGGQLIKNPIPNLRFEYNCNLNWMNLEPTLKGFAVGQTSFKLSNSIHEVSSEDFMWRYGYTSSPVYRDDMKVQWSETGNPLQNLRLFSASVFIHQLQETTTNVIDLQNFAVDLTLLFLVQRGSTVLQVRSGTRGSLADLVLRAIVGVDSFESNQRQGSYSFNLICKQ
ncbi:MAG: hypothetical protein AB7F59_02320 [Bdellovibrionales bacterium]